MLHRGIAIRTGTRHLGVRKSPREAAHCVGSESMDITSPDTTEMILDAPQGRSMPFRRERTILISIDRAKRLG